MSLTDGQKRLYSGDYNYLNQAWQPDGSVVIRISGGKSKRTHLLHVKSLWKKDEEVLFEEEVDTGPPEWVKKRFKEAKEGR